ncbi:MAG: hypothetical protein ACHQZR_09295 [Candidatus Limnocylindrales bacterium]
MEIVIVGYSNDPPLQPIYVVLAALITLVGAAWLRRTSRAPAPPIFSA